MFSVRLFLVIPLNMDGDVEVIRNYRGISLGWCVAKVLLGCWHGG